jgi:integrase
MSETKARRRGFVEDGIYLDAARNRYMGSVSLGYGPGGKRIRRKVSGKTKQEVRAKLQALHEELNAGIKSSSTYIVREAVDDWLREGLDGTSERTRTLYEGLLEPVLEIIGAKLLRDLGARDVRSALSQLATRYSTRSLQITRNSLERAIRHAESNDLVGRNVAALVKTPQGRDGRPSKSFTLEQAKALLAASERTRLHAYAVLSLLVGIRTEEVRALCWDHVVTWVDDAAGWQPVTAAGFESALAGEERYALYVWRSERQGGDTKTEKSRRTLALRRRCVEALRQHWEQQERDRLRAGELWHEHGLVFASRIGTPLSANNVIRAFRLITKKAGLGEDWVPRELRHTFVSVLSASGVPVENIALLVGRTYPVKAPIAQLARIRAADRLFSVPSTRITCIPECAVESVGFLWGSAVVSQSCGVSVGFAEAFDWSRRVRGLTPPPADLYDRSKGWDSCKRFY